MSKRFQRGSVFAVGNKWHGRYWRDVPDKETREHPLVVLGERKEMTKLEARKKLADIIEKEGLNHETFLELTAVRAVTFNHVADAWELKRLPHLALSTRHDAPGPAIRRPWALQFIMQFVTVEVCASRILPSAVAPWAMAPCATAALIAAQIA